eukprot:Gregarina_sp_Pseudo_9__61@NODE_103_length_4267_cov_30_934721_g95_i0_p3_GENE_NODE_103_length_4267_cov_30_934721_g95_i0NODE_103_length_4267_cov_30_934721_g95_i0_p3_ORF_typecomplete_len196_score50_82CENPF_leu_zip/PF10473_9/68CENPF_leu_zip/PF10473_9/0_68IL11/PF07400_11/0_75IL11/PF07400_11/3_1e02IL11/PF07400_11/7_5e02_NODE_103_length_4267_cov_30_934721_g95_i051638
MNDHAELIALLCRLETFSSSLNSLSHELQLLIRDLERLFLRLASSASSAPSPVTPRALWCLARSLLRDWCCWLSRCLLPVFSLPPSTFELLQPAVSVPPSPPFSLANAATADLGDLAIFFELMNRKLQTQASIIRQLEEGSSDRDRLISQLERRLIELCQTRCDHQSSVDSLISSYAATDVSTVDCAPYTRAKQL